MAEQRTVVGLSSRISFLALVLAVCGSASMVHYYLGVFIPRMLEAQAERGLEGYSWGNDFHPVWFTAREAIVAHRDPYSPEMTRQLQIGVFGRPLNPLSPHDPPVQYRQYAYPAFTEVVMWPAALLPFPQLRILLAVLLPLLSVTTLGFWVRALRWQLETLWFLFLVLLTLTSYQMLEALFAEQLGLFVALLLAAAALSIREKRLLLAGVLTSLTLMKPETSALAILYLLLWSFSDRRRARFWQGFAVVSLALTASTLWAWPHWVSEWIHIVLGYTRYAMPPLIQILLGKSVPAYIGKAISGCFIASAAFVAWRNRTASADSRAFWFTLSLVLAITCVAILPGQAIYDHTILIPGIFLTVLNRRTLMAAGWIPRMLLYAGELLLLWPWITAPVVRVMHHWVSTSPSYSPALFALPIRSATPLPFAVLTLLWWTWRVTRTQPEPA
jgi:hypothetical protein